jgi:hypothetical protein
MNRHEEPRMSDSHGNTPAAWTAVTVAMLGFVVAAVGMLIDVDQINWLIFYIGVGIGVGSLVIFAVMAKLGYHNESEH